MAKARRKRLSWLERQIWAPPSYPLVHDCGRQPHGSIPGVCEGDLHPDDPRYRCELPVCPGADCEGALYWVGEERELWRRGPSPRDQLQGLFNPAGVLVPWREALAILLERGARNHYLPGPWMAMLRPRLDAPIQFISEMPQQISLF